MKNLFLSVLFATFCLAVVSATGFTAPLANFVYWPEYPVVSRPVNFDGRSSVANPYPAVNYYWDFDADGIIDAQGAVVNWTFDRVGAKAVKLVVTDWQGQGTEIVKIVPVVYPVVQPRVVTVAQLKINVDMSDMSPGEKIVFVGIIALAMLVGVVLVVRGG